MTEQEQKYTNFQFEVTGKEVFLSMVRHSGSIPTPRDIPPRPNFVPELVGTQAQSLMETEEDLPDWLKEVGEEAYHEQLPSIAPDVSLKTEEESSFWLTEPEAPPTTASLEVPPTTPSAAKPPPLEAAPRIYVHMPSTSESIWGVKQLQEEWLRNVQEWAKFTYEKHGHIDVTDKDLNFLLRANKGQELRDDDGKLLAVYGDMHAARIPLGYDVTINASKTQAGELSFVVELVTLDLSSNELERGEIKDINVKGLGGKAKAWLAKPILENKITKEKLFGSITDSLGIEASHLELTDTGIRLH